MALEDMDIAVKMDPNSSTYVSRAMVFMEGIKFESAVIDLTRALTDESISPDLKVRCFYRRALCYIELKRYDEAIDDLIVNLKLDPNHVATRALYAKALKMVLQLGRAEDQLKLVIEMEPHQASHYLERGDVRFRTGNKDNIIEAIYDFDKGIKILEKKIAIDQEKAQPGKHTEELRTHHLNTENHHNNTNSIDNHNTISKTLLHFSGVLTNGILLGLSWDALPSLTPAVSITKWTILFIFILAYGIGTLVAISISAAIIGESTYFILNDILLVKSKLPMKLAYGSSIAALVFGMIWIFYAFLLYYKSSYLSANELNDGTTNNIILRNINLNILIVGNNLYYISILGFALMILIVYKRKFIHKFYEKYHSG
jgi:tetratricopeptide (TPR) repeat protein